MGKISRLLQVRQPKRTVTMQASEEEVLAYVQQSKVLAHAGRKCVDGRYLPDQATGMIARPGGDCGYVMALMAVNRKKGLGLTPEQCFNAVYNVVSKIDRFCMHTDHHADPDTHTHVGLIGCGHLAKAAVHGHSRDYDVRGEDVKRVVNYARNICEISGSVDMINLSGEHQERAVLIINNDTHTVLADNPVLNQMYFIYDQKRDMAFIKSLVEKLHIEGLTFDDMKRESDLQLHATLHNLAEGLPIFTVDFIGSKPQVTYTGIVEHKSLRSRIPLPSFPHLFLSKFSRSN